MKEGIMDRWEHEVLQSAIRHYGPKHQILKAMEELSELQAELAKFLGGDRNFDRIAEETADVGIMLDQLEMIFENREMVEVWREKKLERLAQRMQEEACRCEPSNPPLTLDELREMDGEPVWVCDCDQSHGCYMLVSVRNRVCVNVDEIAEFNDLGIELIAYRRRPEEEGAT